ncbi:SigB/SigF/SigG family RNA polymerase sigma factor [Streptomyces sp. NPDC000594]|uniref:SigB/SigF/SigG family RNA polymerase sigma factor n=1 Tax=Streptomyces sp. NPDC000594 TaxID=3154261 RepID=UPI0033320E9A
MSPRLDPATPADGAILATGAPTPGATGATGAPTGAGPGIATAADPATALPGTDTETVTDPDPASSWTGAEPPPPAGLGAVDARALSRTLFERLARLEEGTHEHAYVRNTLVELNLSLVRFAAARFRSRSEPMDDIVQVGTIGLIKAIDRFELSRGVEFPTFAMPTVIGEIKRFFRDTTWSVRVPRRLQELRLDLARAGDELTHRLDRSPTVAELAAHLGVAEDEVVEGMAAGNAYTAGSLDARPQGDDRDDTLNDRIGYEDSALEGVEYIESLKPLIARLPARDRRILALRFVGNMTQSDIGEELGISQMQVSRLLSRTLARLREGLTSEG